MNRLLLILLLLSVVGCEAKLTADNSDAAQVAETDRVPSESDADSDRGLLDAAKSLYEQAKDAGTTKAGSARQWFSETVKNSVDSSEATTEQSVQWISEQFNRAKSAGETSAVNAKEWVLEDIQKMGRWEYTQFTVKSSSSAEIIVQEMNGLGRDGWECMFVDRRNETTTFYFKRTARSYLNQIPARELLRLVPLLGRGDAATE